MAEEEAPAEAHGQNGQGRVDHVVRPQVLPQPCHLVEDAVHIVVAGPHLQIEAEVRRHALPPQLVESVGEVETAEDKFTVLRILGIARHLRARSSGHIADDWREQPRRHVVVAAKRIAVSKIQVGKSIGRCKLGCRGRLAQNVGGTTIKDESQLIILLCNTEDTDLRPANSAERQEAGGGQLPDKAFHLALPAKHRVSVGNDVVLRLQLGNLCVALHYPAKRIFGRSPRISYQERTLQDRPGHCTLSNSLHLIGHVWSHGNGSVKLIHITGFEELRECSCGLRWHTQLPHQSSKVTSDTTLGQRRRRHLRPRTSAKPLARSGCIQRVHCRAHFVNVAAETSSPSNTPSLTP